MHLYTHRNTAHVQRLKFPKGLAVGRSIGLFGHTGVKPTIVMGMHNWLKRTPQQK